MPTQPKEKNMRIIDHGTIVVLVPETDEDREWFKENVEGEPNWGGGYACDWRVAVELVSLALAEGLAGAIRWIDD
jgi:hypothetical protein